MDTITKINNDINYLAGATITRRYGTEGELLCSEYIRNRLLDLGLKPVLESFNCFRETFQILSLYWVEYIFVILFSIFFPLGGLLYGLTVAILYFLELTGYFSISQFVPEFQSQNIHTVIRNQENFEEPEYRIIFHANYDCGISHFLYSRMFIDCFPLLHYIIVLCMIGICAISLRDGWFEITPWRDSISMYCRLIPGIFLGTMSLLSLMATTNEEDTRGANFNASGVACLLGLAEYFSRHPIEGTEIRFVFTGANQCWMAGLRHFLKKNSLPKKDTIFINIEGVGSGDLHIITRENMIFSFHVDKDIIDFIQQNKLATDIKMAESLSFPSSAYMALSYGYKGFTIMGLDKDKKPIYQNQIEDTTLHIDEKNIQKTMEILSEFVELWVKK